MAAAFTEVSSIGIGGRLMNSIKGVLAGIVLFIVSFPILWMNEGCAVRTARSLEEGQGAVVEASADKVDAGQEGKLVHLSGKADTGETVKDAVFGVSAVGIRLERSVEMYQWRETSKSRSRRSGGGRRTTRTTYEHDRVWSEKRIDSSKFKYPDGHENPAEMPYRSASFSAGKVTLGAFRLTPALIDRMRGAQRLEADVGGLPEDLKARTRGQAGGFYIGADPASPKIGDMRVSFKLLAPSDVSVIARQVKDTFEKYPTEAGEPLLMLSMGTQSSDAMFKAAHEANRIRTWALRAAGVFAMFIGLMLIAGPLITIADMVPFVGGLMGMGAALFAALIAIVLSLITVSFAWIFYRPVLGGAMLGGAIVLLVLGKLALGKKKDAEPA